MYRSQGVNLPTSALDRPHYGGIERHLDNPPSFLDSPQYKEQCNYVLTKIKESPMSIREIKQKLPKGWDHFRLLADILDTLVAECRVIRHRGLIDKYSRKKVSKKLN